MTPVDYDNHTLTNQVGENLRLALATRRISGRELARRLDVSPNWVSKRIVGEQSPTIEDLEQIAAGINATVTELLGDTLDGLQSLPKVIRDVLETLGDREGYSVEDRQALRDTIRTLHQMFVRTVPRMR